WRVFGVVLGGAVQDFTILFFSLRRDGKSLGQMAKEEGSKVTGVTAMIALLMGWWMKRWRPGKVGEASIVGAVLLLIALVAGGSVASHPGLAAAFTHSGT